MDEFESSFNNVLVETFGHVHKYEETVLKYFLDVPVTITEVHIIEMIGRNTSTEITVSKIASGFNIARPTATIAVRKMEKKGLIKKVSCEKDARRAIISLTELGKKIERVHQIFHIEMARSISKQFSDNEKQVLLKAARALNEYFKTKTEA